MTYPIEGTADAALRRELAAGPQESRAVLASMARQGFTAKQVRRARERLGLEVARSGAGTNTRSTWALPATPAAGVDDTGGTTAAEGDEIAADASDARLRQAKALDVASPALVRKGKVPAEDLQAFELERVAARIELFTARGVDARESAEVARLLVLDRDRAGTRDGSCAECQCLQADGRCTVALAGITAGPRPVRELWQCGWARRNGP